MVIDPDVSDPVTRPDEEDPVTVVAADYYSPNNPCGAWRLSDTDNIAHGTGVASIIGGTNTGVAKNVRIVPIKVATCTNFAIPKLAVARGLDWAINDSRSHNARAVINMSIHFETYLTNVNGVTSDQQVCEDGSGGYTLCLAALENEINNAIAANIPVIVSGNNQSSNMCSVQSPARMGQNSDSSTWSGSYASTYHTITVGGTMATASDYTDRRWTCETAPEQCDPTWAPANTTDGHGSNYGDCVSIWAPAWNIRTASGTGPTNYRPSGGASSGTSFSAGYVTGVVARLLQLNPSLSPLDVWNALVFRANERCQTGGVCPSSFDPSRFNNKLVFMAPSE